MKGKKAVSRNWLLASPEFGFNKDFKVVIIKMFKELKEPKYKKLKKTITTTNQQIQVLSKETEIILKNKKEPKRNSQVEKFSN